VELKEGTDWIEVPCSLPLSASQTSALQDEFQTIQKAWTVPVPLNLFKVKAGIIGLLRLFIERAVPARTEVLSPAQKLRRLIDDDKKSTRNLAVLSRQCGLSSDHMRKLFRERYHIAPQEYRHRQRMGRAMELMVSSELSLPEIAAETGFEHVSHFCTSFKKAFHLTPSQGLKRFRRKSEFVEDKERGGGRNPKMPPKIERPTGVFS
jgi:AraC-like DNA-binding protein